MVIAFPLVGDSMGGAQRSTLELVRALAGRGELRIHLVLHEDNEHVRQMLEGSGVRVSLLASSNFLGPPRFAFRWRWRAALDVVRAAIWCRKHMIDIVHTNDRRIHRIWGAAASRGGARWVLHRRKMGNPPFKDQVLKQASHVVTISDACRASVNKVPSQKLSRIYNAVEAPPNFQRSRPVLRDEVARLLFLGNVIPRKRFDLYAEVASELYLRKPGRYEFHFAGRDATGIARTSLLGLSPAVRERFVLHGEIEDPWELLGKTDILVAPALDEAFGRTLVEAQLAGVVVIASRHSGHEEIIQHGVTGFLAKPDDKNDFVRWVEHVCSARGQEEVKSICGDACRVAQKQYGMERLVAEIRNIYEEISVIETKDLH